MFFEKIKLVAAVVLAVTLLGTGGGFFSRRGEARVESPDEAKKSAAAESPPARKPPEKKEKDRAPGKRGQELRDTLAQVVRYDGVDDPKTTLQDALDMLAARYNVQFEVNEAAFLTEGRVDVLKTEIAAPTPIPAMNATLANVLRRIISRVKGVQATYVIRKDLIEITTGQALGHELHLLDGVPPDDPLNELFGERASQPLVYENFVETPLSDALRTVAESSRDNVVLDLATENKDRPAVITASLHNVRAETAVRTLAALADLEVVRLDNVLFVTTADKAARLRNSWKFQPQRAPHDAEKNAKKSP